VLLRYCPPPRTPVVNGVQTDPFSRSQKFETRESRDKLHEQLLIMSLSYYAVEMLQGPAKSPYRGRVLLGKHHLELDEALREHRRLLVRAARDHGKSFYFCVAYTIWKAHKNHPGSLGYIFSASQTLAEERLKEMTDQLESNDKVNHLVPVGKDRVWSRREVKTTTGTLIRARGWGTKVRGGHPHWIIADDCLDDHSLYSETVRQRSVDFFFSAITNMVVPDGQIVVDGTPLHQTDLYSKIEETGRYFVRNYPARDAKTGEPLFPERYSVAALKDKETEIGPTRFAREFLVQPLTDASSLFPSHLFAGDVRLPYKVGLPAEYWEKMGAIRYSGVDIAMSSEIGSDYFVIFTLAVDGRGRRWIVDIFRERGLPFQAQKDAIKECYAKYLPEVIHIEANQMQRVWPEEIINETAIPIRSFFTSGVQPKHEWKKGMTSVTMNKHHLDRGVPSLRLSLENRLWRIPRGDATSIEKTDTWMGELQCLSLQGGRVVSVGEHDDVAMACWMADTAVRLSGGIAHYWAGDTADAGQDPFDTAPVIKDAAVMRPDKGAEPVAESGVEVEDDWDPFGLKLVGEGRPPTLGYGE